jgi:type III secretion protein T
MDPSPAGASTLGLVSIDWALQTQQLLALIVVCSVRVYAAMMVLPATSDAVLQGTVRNGVALTFGLFVAWGQPQQLLQDLSLPHLVVMVLKEAAIGMIIGMACGTIFWVAEGVGMLIDNQAGYNNVQQTNPMSGQQSTPVGNLLMQLAIASFYMLGGLLVFAGLMLDSFRWWPLTSAMPSWDHLLEGFLPLEIRSYGEAVLKVAGPIMMMMTIIDLGIGLLGKAAEKLEPGSLGQPIKGATAMLMLALLVAVFFQQVRPDLSLQPLKQRLEKMMQPVSQTRTSGGTAPATSPGHSSAPQ